MLLEWEVDELSAADVLRRCGCEGDDAVPYLGEGVGPAHGLEVIVTKPSLLEHGEKCVGCSSQEHHDQGAVCVCLNPKVLVFSKGDIEMLMACLGPSVSMDDRQVRVPR